MSFTTTHDRNHRAWPKCHFCYMVSFIPCSLLLFDFKGKKEGYTCEAYRRVYVFAITFNITSS